MKIKMKALSARASYADAVAARVAAAVRQASRNLQTK